MKSTHVDSLYINSISCLVLQSILIHIVISKQSRPIPPVLLHGTVRICWASVSPTSLCPLAHDQFYALFISLTLTIHTFPEAPEFPQKLFFEMK